LYRVDGDEPIPRDESIELTQGDEFDAIPGTTPYGSLPLTDGGRPAASTGGGRHAPAMAGSTTPERTYAHYCDEVGSTVYATGLKI